MDVARGQASCLWKQTRVFSYLLSVLCLDSRNNMHAQVSQRRSQADWSKQYFTLCLQETNSMQSNRYFCAVVGMYTCTLKQTYPPTCASMCRLRPRRPPPTTSGPSASSNNKAVLEDVVKAIDAVARPNGPPLASTSALTPPASASPAPTATATAAANTKQPTAVSGGGGGGGGAAVSEVDGVARQQSRFSGTAAVDAADGGGSGGGVGGAVDGKVFGARADAIISVNGSSAGFGRPSGEATTTNDVLAAAAEVNGGAAGDSSSACEAARLSGGGVRPATTTGGGGGGDSAVEARMGDKSAVGAAAAGAAAAAVCGPAGENSRGVDAVVAVEPGGTPPVSMAEVRRSSRDVSGGRCGDHVE